jgi:hypothetical protein
MGESNDFQTTTLPTGAHLGVSVDLAGRPRNQPECADSEPQRLLSLVRRRRNRGVCSCIRDSRRTEVVGMTESLNFRTDLLIAWERWDKHCSKVHADPHNHNKEPLGCPTTERMEDACQTYAKNLGVDCTDMRASLSALRRSGLSREQSLENYTIKTDV